MRASQRNQTRISKKDKSTHRSLQVRFEQLNSQPLYFKGNVAHFQLNICKFKYKRNEMYNHFVCQLTDARLMDVNKKYKND